MRFVAPALSLAALSLVCPALQPAAEAQTRAKIDLAKIGPKVGERVPDFELKDQNGNTQTLRSIMGPKGAMLVFHRSANW
jgi:hypothetical protein